MPGSVAGHALVSRCLLGSALQELWDSILAWIAVGGFPGGRRRARYHLHRGRTNHVEAVELAENDRRNRLSRDSPDMDLADAVCLLGPLTVPGAQSHIFHGPFLKKGLYAWRDLAIRSRL